jgi:uncharacterized membrane protein
VLNTRSTVFWDIAAISIVKASDKSGIRLCGYFSHPRAAHLSSSSLYYVYIYIYIYICVCVCVCGCVCVLRLCVCLCFCVYVFVCVLSRLICVYDSSSQRKKTQLGFPCP